MCNHHWEIQGQEEQTLHLECTRCGLKESRNAVSSHLAALDEIERAKARIAQLEVALKESDYCERCKPMADEGKHFRHDGVPCAYHPGDCSEVGHIHQWCPCGRIDNAEARITQLEAENDKLREGIKAIKQQMCMFPDPRTDEEKLTAQIVAMCDLALQENILAAALAPLLSGKGEE